MALCLLIFHVLCHILSPFLTPAFSQPLHPAPSLYSLFGVRCLPRLLSDINPISTLHHLRIADTGIGHENMGKLRLSDEHKENWKGRPSLTQPGTVLETGPGVTLLQKGDRIVLPFNVACGRCQNCEEGSTAFCTGVNEGFAGG